jgi:hypothetical protein
MDRLTCEGRIYAEVSDMQARLSIQRFPTRMATSLVALIAALTLGGFLGYTAKPATVVTGTTHTVVVPFEAPGQALDRAGRSAGP